MNRRRDVCSPGWRGFFKRNESSCCRRKFMERRTRGRRFCARAEPATARGVLTLSFLIPASSSSRSTEAYAAFKPGGFRPWGGVARAFERFNVWAGGRDDYGKVMASVFSMSPPSLRRSRQLGRGRLRELPYGRSACSATPRGGLTPMVFPFREWSAPGFICAISRVGTRNSTRSAMDFTAAGAGLGARLIPHSRPALECRRRAGAVARWICWPSLERPGRLAARPS